MILSTLQDIFWLVLNVVVFFAVWRLLRQAFGPIWKAIKEDDYAPRMLFLRLLFSFLLVIVSTLCFHEAVDQVKVWFLLFA